VAFEGGKEGEKSRLPSAVSAEREGRSNFHLFFVREARSGGSRGGKRREARCTNRPAPSVLRAREGSRMFLKKIPPHRGPGRQQRRRGERLVPGKKEEKKKETPCASRKLWIDPYKAVPQRELTVLAEGRAIALKGKKGGGGTDGRNLLANGASRRRGGKEGTSYRKRKGRKNTCFILNHLAARGEKALGESPEHCLSSREKEGEGFSLRDRFRGGKGKEEFFPGQEKTVFWL